MVEPEIVDDEPVADTNDKDDDLVLPDSKKRRKLANKKLKKKSQADVDLGDDLGGWSSVDLTQTHTLNAGLEGLISFEEIDASEFFGGTKRKVISLADVNADAAEVRNHLKPLE